MKRSGRLIVLTAAILAGFAANAMYTGMAGRMSLPTGGSEVRRGGGGEVTIGGYASDNLAMEVTAGMVESDGAIAVDAVYHWSGWALYDRYLGFSKWDPFLLGGAAAIWGEDNEWGPEGGMGLYYHLDDHWSLRASAKCRLGLAGDAAAAWVIAAGVVLDF